MSALLDTGPHIVTIYVEETYVDSYGNTLKRPSQTGVLVRGCLVTPVPGSRAPGSDRRAGSELFKFLARTAPLGKWSRVVWEHDGQTRTLAVESGPDVFGVSDATRHITATLIAE